MRKYLAFVLLGILTLAGAGFAIIGAVQSPAPAPSGKAVTNTLKAANFSEQLIERTPQGNQTASLVFQSPDRLGGWLLSGKRKTYIYIIGTTEYIAVTTSATAPQPTKFYTQKTTGAVAVDPAHTYLSYYNKGPATHKGAVTTVTLSQGGQKEVLTYTVTGNYVSHFNAVTPGGTIDLDITNVGTSPGVQLPKGHTVTTTPPSQG
jgi:hypothetical protein